MTTQQNQLQKQEQNPGSSILQVDVVFFEAGSAWEIPGEVYWRLLGECGGWVRYSMGEVFCVSNQSVESGVWFGRVVDRCFRLDGDKGMDINLVITAFKHAATEV